MVSESVDRPLILTLQLDSGSQQFFDAQRERFFPPAINYLRAHVTLFHHLPGSQLSQVQNDLQQAADRQTALPIQVMGLRSLGRGVAYTLESALLASLRAQLAKSWSGWLTPQDQQKFRPHVTVQNKVTREEAERTLALLGGSFSPHSIEATGLDLWRYEGGPWEHLHTFSFR